MRLKKIMGFPGIQDSQGRFKILTHLPGSLPNSDPINKYRPIGAIHIPKKILVYRKQVSGLLLSFDPHLEELR